ncbi:hypothetical protein [Halotalea alkalilenta]|nr:hypothetical protein [Halotalea alkalilenta]
MVGISVWALIWIIAPLLVGFGVWTVFAGRGGRATGTPAAAAKKHTPSSN